MQLTPEQVAQFAADGYLLLRGVLTDADLDPIIAEYEEYIGRRAEGLLTAGHISALYADEPFYPDFVARSRSNPASELRDYDEWCRQWVESLAAVQGQGVKAHRWEVVQ